MPRKSLELSSEFPYHVTARCLNKEWFELPLDCVWSIMEDYLYFCSHCYGIQIHSFILMSNHIHLIVTAPQNNISAFLNYFLRETSREISRLTGRINQTYGARNYKCLIKSYHYYMNAYKYLYRNPVRAGICKFVEDYKYSTLNGILGGQKLIIPLIEDTLLFNPDFDSSTLQWLNRDTKKEHDEEMRLALRRPIFRLTKNRSSGHKSDLEMLLI